MFTKKQMVAFVFSSYTDSIIARVCKCGPFPFPLLIVSGFIISILKQIETPFVTKYDMVNRYNIRRWKMKNFIDEFLQNADALLHACFYGNNNNIQYIRR